MVRKGFFLLVATLAAAAGIATTVGVAGASAHQTFKGVRYGAYRIRVPASWPVYDLGANPSRCVRFDRHAVYLGPPGADQRCPARAVGHTEAISIEPLHGGTAHAEQPNTIRPARGGVAPSAFPPASAAEVQLAVPSAGVLVNASWRGGGRRVIRRILDRANQVAGAERPPSPGPTPRERAPKRISSRGSSPSSYFTGLGFDACTAPSSSAMSAWSSSPYHAVGIYIGGANRGCSQPNLSPAWVQGVLGAGWRLMPIYVGLQAPGTSCPCARMGAHAKAQGKSAAADAVHDAQSLDLGAKAPIYFDLEAYSRNARNSSTVLRFLAGWTSRLHRLGYVSGVYSSAASGISDLVSRYGTGYTEPDDVWIGDWNGQRTTSDPYVPDRFWSQHQRVHQYRGGHTESYGGVSINIDNDFLDGAVVSGADRDRDGVQDASDLCRTVPGLLQNLGCPYPSYVSGELKSYYGFAKRDRHHGDLYATTSGVSAAYRFRANLGFLYPVSQPGPVPLYSCRAHNDRFLSAASGCEGHGRGHKLGYASPSEPEGVPSRAIFSCRLANGERFASANPDCQRFGSGAGLLGFTVSTTPLVGYTRWVPGDPHRGDPYTTTAGAGAAYRFQRNLGLLYESNQPGTAPLYSCRSGSNRFVSAASDCEGADVVARLGYAYSSQPDGIPTRAIFRCRLPDDQRTVSSDPACGGPPNVDEGSLGFTISIAPLGTYYDSVKGDRNYGDHEATTAGVGRAYRFQRNLGFLYQSSQPGTVPFLSCQVGRDRFLSASSGCGGGKVIRTVGYAYSSRPLGIPTHGIFGCHQADGERFVALSPSCGRASNTSTGPLGYALVSPLGG